VLLVVALSALVAVAGCGGGTTESAPAEQTVRQPAPEVEGVTIEGERISLEEFRGRPVFVNVWSSW
jgi:FlaG/FlaF family flagellin (archaellin)